MPITLAGWSAIFDDLLLCETTAGSITGANLVTTGDFAVDANWIKGNRMDHCRG
jgi:hypothetical protein